MKALIFAAGLGTRLRPLTDSIPKAMVEVGQWPMLRHVIEKLKKAGVSEMVINIHHFPDKIIDYLQANENFGINIRISDERDLLLETGGGLLKAREWLDGDEPILLHNADILTDFNIPEMLENHINSGSDVTLLVSHRHSSRYLLFDDGMLMQGWTNTKTGEMKPAGLCADNLNRFAFGGVHIVSPGIFRQLRDYAHGNPAFSIVPFYIAYCRQLKIKGYTPVENYCWFDIGKPETLEQARIAVEKSSNFSLSIKNK